MIPNKIAVNIAAQLCAVRGGVGNNAKVKRRKSERLEVSVTAYKMPVLQHWTDPALVVAAISRLFLLCRPTTVAGLVIAVIVDAIKAETGWSWPHVSQKVLEFSPSVADSNTATAVIIPIWNLGICASLNHRNPCFILARHFSNWRVAVFSSQCKRLLTPTTATHHKTIDKIVALNCLPLSASAVAFPLRSTNARNQFEHCEASKCLP